MTRQELLDSIATTIGDYRTDALPQPTPEHVDRWVRQFGDQVQEPILAEMAYVLGKTYFSRNFVEKLISRLVANENLAGFNCSEFWKATKFLDIQARGNSQSEMLAMFNAAIREKFGFGLSACGDEPEQFIYLDDAIFSGGHVISDLTAWIEGAAPAKTELHIIRSAFTRTGDTTQMDSLRKLLRPRENPSSSGGGDISRSRIGKGTFTIPMFCDRRAFPQTRTHMRTPQDWKMRASRRYFGRLVASAGDPFSHPKRAGIC